MTVDSGQKSHSIISFPDADLRLGSSILAREESRSDQANGSSSLLHSPSKAKRGIRKSLMPTNKSIISAVSKELPRG